MKLSEEQKKKLISKLNSFGVPSQCPICKSGTWTVSDTIFELREFQGGSLVIGGNQGIYPVIPLTCSNCGNTYFLNPLMLGILEPPKKKEGQE